jgi:hypothetical protein
MIKKIMIAIVALNLVSFQVLAKTTKSNEQSPTLLSNTTSSGTGFSMESLKGLSIVGAYDTSDDAKIKGGTIQTDKSFAVGAEYEFSQIAPGIAWQVGALYEFKKEIENSNGAKYQLWTGYAELVGKLTQKIKIFGGLNYNRPDLSGADGADLDGDFGYQFGASYMPTKNFAMDVRFRQIKMDYEESGVDDFGTPAKFTTSVKSDGLMFGGRYMF